MSQLNHRTCTLQTKKLGKQAKLLLATEQVSRKTICPSSKSGNLQTRNILLSCQLWPAISCGLALLSHIKGEIKEHSLYSWQDRKYNCLPHRSHTAVAILEVKQPGSEHKFCCFKGRGVKEPLYCFQNLVCVHDNSPIDRPNSKHKGFEQKSRKLC